MAATSGLSPRHRRKARRLTVKAARLGLKRAPSLHYTQGSQRWEGIDKKCKAYKDECPQHGDCSAFATWCIWNGLDHYGVRDVVNGAKWKYGYTGTMVKKGVRVNGRKRRGDLVLYGDPFGPTGHVAVYVGLGMVISFGSDIGPLLLPVSYRPVTQVRRYI